jgi:hypothetical protein
MRTTAPSAVKLSSSSAIGGIGSSLVGVRVVSHYIATRGHRLSRRQAAGVPGGACQLGRPVAWPKTAKWTRENSISALHSRSARIEYFYCLRCLRSVANEHRRRTSLRWRARRKAVRATMSYGTTWRRLKHSIACTRLSSLLARPPDAGNRPAYGRHRGLLKPTNVRPNVGLWKVLQYIRGGRPIGLIDSKFSPNRSSVRATKHLFANSSLSRSARRQSGYSPS